MCCRDPRRGGGLPELPPQDPAVRAHQHRPNHPESGFVCLRGDAHQRGHGERENENVCLGHSVPVVVSVGVCNDTQGDKRKTNNNEKTKSEMSGGKRWDKEEQKEMN